MKKSGKGVYIPDQGDIIWIDFDPQVGNEQAKRRPALVITKILYNALPRHLALVCPIKTKSTNYPFEVPLVEGMETEGVVIADQIKSMDWKGREAVFIEKAPIFLLKSVVEKVYTLFPDFTDNY